MAHDFDREGPLDIFIMALYRVDKVGGRVVYVKQCLRKKKYREAGVYFLFKK